MNGKKKTPRDRKDPIEVVTPFARIRIIFFLVCLAVAAVVLAYRAFTG